ncbi:heparanase [Holotrichia oblita]|uniref:Heparanase n=1 Tax=Holotrichia oblita TaxID=644536 RepID=A0ACB9T526_HOLOL|nr:heparanase [Holotrichia oblita]
MEPDDEESLSLPGWAMRNNIIKVPFNELTVYERIDNCLQTCDNSSDIDIAASVSSHIQAAEETSQEKDVEKEVSEQSTMQQVYNAIATMSTHIEINNYDNKKWCARGEDEHWIYSMQSCINQFTVAEYPDDTFVQYVNRLTKRFIETGSILKRKRKARPTVLTEDNVADIRNRVEANPNKYIHTKIVCASRKLMEINMKQDPTVTKNPYPKQFLSDLQSINTIITAKSE